MNTLRDYAMSFVGQPYRWGGDDPINGFDCSGLVQEILASVGMDPLADQTADALYRLWKAKGTPQRTLGALAFYGTEARVTHVAFLLDGNRIVEAGGGGSKTLTKEDAANQNAYVRIRPVDNRKDLVGVYFVAYPSWVK
jgi:cell wall-associated NlpC family hydrolase